jgi:hypothetical protein
MLSPSHSSWFYQPHDIGWGVQNIYTWYPLVINMLIFLFVGRPSNLLKIGSVYISSPLSHARNTSSSPGIFPQRLK